MGSFSIWHWLIVLVIVLLVFGTKVKGFKDGLKEGDSKADAPAQPSQQIPGGQTIEGEIKEKTKS